MNDDSKKDKGTSLDEAAMKKAIAETMSEVVPGIEKVVAVDEATGEETTLVDVKAELAQVTDSPTVQSGTAVPGEAKGDFLKLELMDGTDSKGDYLVVAKPEGFKVGLKIDGIWAFPVPIAKLLTRIRVEKTDPALLFTPHLVAEKFPNFPGWNSGSDHHVSYSAGVDMKAGNLEELMQNAVASGFIATAIENLKKLGVELQYDAATIEAWALGRVKEVAAKYKAVADAMLAKKMGVATPKPPKTPKPKVDADGAVIEGEGEEEEHPNVTLLPLPKGTKPVTH